MTNKEINIEDLAEDFEERVMNNEFYEDVTITFRDKNVHCRIRPIPHFEFNKFKKNIKSKDATEDLMNLNFEIVAYGLLNKHDNQPFSRENLLKIFPIGLIVQLAEKILLISGLIDESKEKELEFFPKQNVTL